MKLISKIKSSKLFKKTVAAIASASVAVSAFAVNAFAADGTGGGASVSTALSQLGPKITSAFTEIVNTCIDIGVSVLPLGLSIFGAIKLWDVAKKFFTKATI